MLTLKAVFIKTSNEFNKHKRIRIARNRESIMMALLVLPIVLWPRHEQARH